MRRNRIQKQNSKSRIRRLHSIASQSLGSRLPPPPQSTSASASSSSQPTSATPKASKASPSVSSPKPNISAPANPTHSKTQSPPNSPTAKSNSSVTKVQNENSPMTVNIWNERLKNSVNKLSKSRWGPPSHRKLSPTRRRNGIRLGAQVFLK